MNKLNKPVAEIKCHEDLSLSVINVRDGFSLGRHKVYSQEYVSALLAELEAKDKRIAELESIREDASQVFKEIGNELGCNPDNESIMMAIDDLKATQMTGPLKDVLKRNIELEAKLATPVRLPTKYSMLHREDFHDDYQSKMVFKADDVIAALRAAGFTVEGG